MLLAAMFMLVFSANSQIFYRVEGNGLKNPSYIFGTHHLAPLSVIDEIPGCRQALDSAEIVVGEIDMTLDQMSLAMKMQPFMMAPSDSTLSKVISPDKFAKVREEFRKYAPMPGMEIDMLEPMKPMVITTMVSVQIVKDKLPGYNPAEQLDTYFQQFAKENGKTVRGLETPEFQAEILYGTETIANQAKALVELLENPAEAIEKSEAMNNAYLKQDMAALLDIAKSEEADADKFINVIVNQRNANWISEIPEIINDTSAFIAVGALHLPGEKGIIEGLRRAGYTVTPISK